MAEFSRLQLIVGEDLIRSLGTLCTNLETYSETLISDIARTIDLPPDDPRSHQIKAALQKFQQSAVLMATLPLTEVESASEGMETFMRCRLSKLGSQDESRVLIGELSKRLANHTSRVQELVQLPELDDDGVFQRISAHQCPSAPRGQLLTRHS